MIALMLRPREQAADHGAAPEPLHICRTVDIDEDYWEMFCGLVVRVFDDGTVAPQVDFYFVEHGYKATCEQCLAANHKVRS